MRIRLDCDNDYMYLRQNLNRFILSIQLRMAVRIRQEYVARDQANSRAWDFFHATPPTQISSTDLQTKNAPVHMDMNPICSRLNTVQYRIQPQYIPDPKKGEPYVKPGQYSTNPYTQRLDAGGADARNMIRELRGAVTEDNRESQMDADQKLIERQFYDRLLTGGEPPSLKAYELLRAKPDDWRTM